MKASAGAVPTHGGARPGAGRKPKAEQGDAQEIYAKARAKKEVHLANLAELDYRQRAGELYDRGEVLSVISTAVAVFAEQLRSLPDKLERQAGLTPEQASLAEDEVNAQLAELKLQILKAVADA